MCGIAGFFEARMAAEAVPRVLQRMGDAIEHRGPDQSGTLAISELAAGLASRRLSLVDVAGGRQPLSNEDGSIHVVFNGEIYNHLELRKSLEGRGHRFSTHCDTEVIVHLYEDLGLESLDRLQGMFALAILDMRERRLVLARDGSGMKSLYWARTPAGFVFASEVKALLASGLVQARPDLGALRTYLAAGFFPAPLTGFEGIEKLAAGRWLVVEDGRVEGGHFWRPKFQKQRPRLREREYALQLEELLQDSVRRHMAADVPVGAFLSGGWDSSLVASYAARLAPGRLKTFSIVFPEDPATDESRYSRRMAEHIGSEHHEIEFRTPQFAELLPQTVRHMEEPHSRGPTVLHYQLAKFASTEVKSVVSGEGSDELFAGYPWFRSRDFTAGELLRGILPPATAGRLRSLRLGRHWDAMLRVANAPDQAAVDVEWMLRLHRVNLKLLHPDLRDAPWNPRDPLPHPSILESCEDRLQRRLAIEFSGRLSDGILLETDKMSMAHSLETRMPFLHRPVIDFALKLPTDLKRRRGQEKAILRRLVRDLPPEIAGRRKKGLWYPRDYTAHPSVRGTIRSLLLDSSTPAPILAERRILEQQLDANLASSAPMSGFLCVAVLQCWWNEFFGDSPGRGPATARPVA